MMKPPEPEISHKFLFSKLSVQVNYPFLRFLFYKKRYNVIFGDWGNSLLLYSKKVNKHLA
jgi:hypothetical protein